VLRIRDAGEDDTEAIVSATANGWQTAYRGIVTDERLADLPVDRWRKEIGEGLRNPIGDAFTRVAEVDGAFAGYCFVAAPPREAQDAAPGVAELVALYVNDEHRSLGAGGALTKAALERLAELGYERVFLWTFAENERAIAFYERHGWSRDGEEKVHERAQAVAVRLQRPVP
jgi:ribosomal protein S18 acetylase RimI-like enzyme